MNYDPENLEMERALELSISTLPEYHGSERRKHALTKADGEWIVTAIKIALSHQTCSLGLNDAQATALASLSPDHIHNIKDIIKERRRMLALLGTMIVSGLAYIGGKVLDAIDPKFWKSLLHIGHF